MPKCQSHIFEIYFFPKYETYKKNRNPCISSCNHLLCQIWNHSHICSNMLLHITPAFYFIIAAFFFNHDGFWFTALFSHVTALPKKFLNSNILVWIFKRQNKSGPKKSFLAYKLKKKRKRRKTVCMAVLPKVCTDTYVNLCHQIPLGWQQLL